MKLKDKVVVVTGASKGLGREIALKLSEQGAKLAIVARSEKELQELKNLIVKQGNECEYYVCDIVDDKQIFSTVKNIIERFKTIDVLINNAGIWFEGSLESHTIEKIKDIFNVVTLGTIFFTKAVVPFMKKQKNGQILNIVSVAGIEAPGVDNGPYSAYTGAKFAVRGFTEALKEELSGTGIKVIGFYPGGMNTEIFRTAGLNYSDNEDWMMDKKDVAEIIVYVLGTPDDVVIDHVVVRKFQKS